MKLFLSIVLFFGLSYNLFAYTKTFTFQNNKEIKNHRIAFSYSFQIDTNNSNTNYNDESNDNKIVMIDITLQDNTSLSYEVQLQEGYHVLYWYPHIIGNVISLRLHYNDSVSIHTLNFLVERRPIPTDTVEGYTIVSASLEDIFNWQPFVKTTQKNTDMYIFRWQSYPDVVIFAFKNKAIQADYLKRIAFYTEKVGYRGRIVDVAAIKHRSGWTAHNYRALDFAMFYNATLKREQHEDIPPLLNERETKLKNILLSLGIINQTGDYYFTTNDKHNIPIVSFMRTLNPSLKRVLTFHELLHSFFYRDEVLRSKVDALWGQFSPTDTLLWREFLSYNSYDPDFNYLLKNELFAYLLQRSKKALLWYRYSRIITDAMRRLGQNTITKSEQKHFADILLRSAEQLSAYMINTYGVVDGDLRYVKIKE